MSVNSGGMAAPEGPGRGGQQITAGNSQLKADGG